MWLAAPIWDSRDENISISGQCYSIDYKTLVLRAMLGILNFILEVISELPKDSDFSRAF